MEKRSIHLQVQLAICLVMLALALIGLVVMNFYPAAFWKYSLWMAFLYAVMSIGMFLYTHRGQDLFFSTVWHQLLHWLGMLLAIMVIFTFVRTEVITSIQAGMVMLMLLAFSIFLAGVYADPFFMIIGLVLGVFAVAASYIHAYLPLLMIPVILVAAGLIFVLIHHEKKKVVE
jgi:hypothetical protein